jgi:ABC-type transport system involved in multi-copper enzyme maturation permease subunit
LKISEPAPTPEEARLLERIGKAEAASGVCLVIAVLIVLMLAAILFNAGGGPDGGFVGMVVAFSAVIWGPLLVILALGILFALLSKRKAKAQLRELREGQKRLN